MLLDKAQAIKETLNSKFWNLDVRVVDLGLSASSGVQRAKIEIRTPTMGRYTFEESEKVVKAHSPYAGMNLSVEGKSVLISYE